MASRPSLVTPSGRLRCSVAVISLSEDAKVEIKPVGLKIDTQGWQGNNGTVYDQRCFLDLDLHTTNNFAPNEYIGVVNSFGLVVYKGSTQEMKVQRKVKAESKSRV